MITAAGNMLSSISTVVRVDQDEQNDFNLEIATDMETLRREGLGRRSSFFTNSCVAPPATTYQILASPGSNQYIGLTSGASPGALSNVLFPLDADMTAMDSFFIQDVSTNSNTYNITLNTQGSTKIYGPGLSTSGVTTITITDNGGYKEFIYVTTNKIYMISKSA